MNPADADRCDVTQVGALIQAHVEAAERREEELARMEAEAEQNTPRRGRKGRRGRRGANSQPVRSGGQRAAGISDTIRARVAHARGEAPAPEPAPTDPATVTTLARRMGGG